MTVKARLGGVVEWLQERPRPTGTQLLKASPIVLVVIAMLVLVGRNYDTVDFPDYAVPEGFVPRPPPTTRPLGAELPALAGVAGTTVVEVPPNVGTSRLAGTVSGPAGAVVGAVVRIERRIMGTTQVLEVATNDTGGWSASGIGGGRYRVRAFLPPLLASRTAEVFLLPAGESRSVDLVVEQFDQPSVALASAPAPAFLNQQVNVAVRVVTRFVDGDGLVGVQPLPGASADVATSASWTRTSAPGAVITDAAGQAVITFLCRQVGSVQVTATVRINPTASPLVATASFDCVDPATLTTTTVPGDGGTPSSTTTTTIVATTTSTTQPP